MEATHDRLAIARREYLRATDGKLWGKPRKGGESQYLLTGFAKCGECGHSMFVHTRSHGRRRVAFYGCTGYHKRGRSVCTNVREVPLTAADEALLRQLELAVLQPEIIQDAVQAALERLRPTLDARLGTKAHLERERTTVQTEIDRLVAAVAGGGMLSGLLEDLQGREARRADLDRQIAALKAQEEAVKVDWGTVKRRLVERVTDWRGLLRSHVPQARQLLRKLLAGPVRFAPVKGGHRFEARITLGRISFGIIDPTSVASPTGTALALEAEIRLTLGGSGVVAFRPGAQIAHKSVRLAPMRIVAVPLRRYRASVSGLRPLEPARPSVWFQVRWY